MKQQGLGCLYCLSVVYGPVFAFNYYTKLNSNRHLEATGSHVHVRPSTARPPTRALYILHTQTHLGDPSAAEVRTKTLTRLLVLLGRRRRRLCVCGSVRLLFEVFCCVPPPPPAEQEASG